MTFSRIGSYEPLIELASGGMGVIYVARKVGDAGFERLVVLKRVHEHHLVDPAFHKMLRDEARLLSRMHDARIASVIDVIESDGQLSLVLEYVESVSLAALLASARRRGDRLPIGIAARIVADALAGLHAAHEATSTEGAPLGIIHRDVSPQNIIVGLDGTSRIIDFGIAKMTAHPREGETSGTEAGLLKGKLRYMSPEQVKQQALDRRSDVFSAGVVLYEAVTGEHVYRAAEEGDLLLSLLLGDLKLPSEWVPDLPPALEEVILTALALHRDDRFATAAEFEEALERASPIAPTREVARFVEAEGGQIIRQRRQQIREQMRQRATASVPPPKLSRPAPPAAAAAPSARARPWIWMLMVSLAGLAIGSVTLAWRRPRPEPPPSAASPRASVADTPIVSSAVSSASSSAAAASAAPIPSPPSAPARRDPWRPSRTPDLRPNPYGRH